MDLLLSLHKYDEAWAFYNTIPEELKVKDRLALQSGAAAVEVGELEYVENLFKREFSVIREGENSTTDIWFKYKARKIAKERGVEFSKELLEEVINTMDPPLEIDFRMHVTKKNDTTEKTAVK